MTLALVKESLVKTLKETVIILIQRMISQVFLQLLNCLLTKRFILHYFIFFELILHTQYHEFRDYNLQQLLQYISIIINEFCRMKNQETNSES